MMTPRARFNTLVPALFLLTGCSTVYDAQGKTPLGTGGPHVYGGVRTIFRGGGFVEDYSKTAGPFIGVLAAGGCDNRWGALVAGMGLAPILADLSLSFVTDTLILPCTCSRSRRGVSGEEPPEIRSYERPPFRP
jgi:uncharacterized protein YceK